MANWGEQNCTYSHSIYNDRFLCAPFGLQFHQGKEQGTLFPIMGTQGDPPTPPNPKK